MKRPGAEELLNSNNTVMVHIRRLREKMHEPPENPRFIKTVWGVGYKLKSKTLERALKKSIMLRFLLTAVLVSLLYLGLLYLSFTALRTFLSNLLLPLLGTQMYYSLMDTKVFWLTFGYVVVMGVVMFRTVPHHRVRHPHRGIGGHGVQQGGHAHPAARSWRTCS